MITLEFPGRMQSSRNTSKQASYFDHATSLFNHDRGSDSLNERFFSAAKNGNLERIQNFLARASKHSSVNVDTKDKQTGNTALIYAALNNDKNMISLLLKYGADITLCNNEGYSVLDLAPDNLRRILLDSVQRRGASARTLLQAAWQGNIKVLKRLLNLEFDVNCQNADGFTPLLLVTRDVQLFEKIEKSVKEEGYKPLEVVEELLQSNADCKAGDSEGRSALHLLAPDKSDKAVSMTSLLINRGHCHVDVPDNHMNSPLHFASREDNCPTVIALIRGGADVNIKGDSGRTPLHLAADRGHAKVTSVLLDHGADVTLVDDYGHSPVDLAKGEKVQLTLREAWAVKAEKTANNVRCITPELRAMPTPQRAITPEIIQVRSNSNQATTSPKKLRKRSISAKPILGRNPNSARRPSMENVSRKPPSTSASRTQAAASSSARAQPKTGVCGDSSAKLPTLSVLNVQFNYVKSTTHGTSYWLGSHAERLPRPPHGLTHQFSSPALLRRAYVFPPRTAPADDTRGRSLSDTTVPRLRTEETHTRCSLPSRIMPLPGRRLTSPELRSSHPTPLSCVGAMIDLDILRRDVQGSTGLPTPSVAFEKDGLPSPPPSSPIDREAPEEQPISAKSEKPEKPEENKTPQDQLTSESSVVESRGNESDEVTESSTDLYSTQTIISRPRSTFWIPYGEMESGGESGRTEDNSGEGRERKASESGSTFFIDMNNLQGLISGPGEACVKAKSSGKASEITEAVPPTVESPRSPSKGEQFWVPLASKSVPTLKGNTTDYSVSCKCDEVTGICSCTVVKVRASSTSPSQEQSKRVSGQTSPELDASVGVPTDEGCASTSGRLADCEDKKSLTEGSLARVSLQSGGEDTTVQSTATQLTKANTADVLTKGGGSPAHCSSVDAGDGVKENLTDSVDDTKSEIRLDLCGPCRGDNRPKVSGELVAEGSNSCSKCLQNEPVPSQSSMNEMANFPEDEENLKVSSRPNLDEKTSSPSDHSVEQGLGNSKNFQEETARTDLSPSPPKHAWATPRGEEPKSCVVIVNSFPSPEPRADRPTIQSPIVPVATNRAVVTKAGKKGKKAGRSKSGKGKSADGKRSKSGKGSGKKKGKKSKNVDEEIRMIQVKQETPDETGSLGPDAHGDLDVPAPPLLDSNKMLNSKLYRGRYLILSPILESPRSPATTPREEKAHDEPSTDPAAPVGNLEYSAAVDVPPPNPGEEEQGFDVVDGGFFSKLVGSCVPRLNLAATNSDSDTEETGPLIEQGQILNSGRTRLESTAESNSGRTSLNQESMENHSFLEDANVSKKTGWAVSPVEDEADDYIESVLSGMINENIDPSHRTNFSETTTGQAIHQDVTGSHRGDSLKQQILIEQGGQGGFSKPLPRKSFPEDAAPYDVTGREESLMEIGRNERSERFTEEQWLYDGDDSDAESTGSYVSDEDETGSESSSTDDELVIAPSSVTPPSSFDSYSSLGRQTGTPFSDVSMDTDFGRGSSALTLRSGGHFSATLQSHASGGSGFSDRSSSFSASSDHSSATLQSHTSGGSGFSDRSSSFSTSSDECLLRSRIGSSCRSQSVASQGEEIVWKKGNILGKGAFGQVWLGLTNTGEMIAVKQVELHSSDRDTEQAEKQYEMLQEEVTLLKTLRHENVVRYIGTCLEGRVVNIFMEFVPGGSIASILSRFGTLSESVFQRYTKQLVSGVAYLHRNNVIHRDIKGGNLMIMPNGVLKLIDFGCAKRQYINLSLSRSNVLRSMKGTPYWMAPEVIMETGHGRKADIWSIGCTVFEMATGKPPWAEMPAMAAIFAIGSGSPVPKLGDEFSEESRDFVNCCMTRDPDQRPSATELRKHEFIAP